MSKFYCNIKFDNEMLRDEFVRLLPNISPDISAFLKSGMEAKGVEADPEILVDDSKEVIKINLLSKNKGPVFSLEGEGVGITDYSEIGDNDLYALLDPRTKNINVFVKGGDIDMGLGAFATLKGLIDGKDDIKKPIQEAPMELLENNDEVIEAEIVETNLVPDAKGD